MFFRQKQHLRVLQENGEPVQQESLDLDVPSLAPACLACGLGWAASTAY